MSVSFRLNEKHVSSAPSPPTEDSSFCGEYFNHIHVLTLSVGFVLVFLTAGHFTSTPLYFATAKNIQLSRSLLKNSQKQTGKTSMKCHVTWCTVLHSWLFSLEIVFFSLWTYKITTQCCKMCVLSYTHTHTPVFTGWIHITWYSFHVFVPCEAAQPEGRPATQAWSGFS